MKRAVHPGNPLLYLDNFRILMHSIKLLFDFWIGIELKIKLKIKLIVILSDFLFKFVG